MKGRLKGEGEMDRVFDGWGSKFKVLLAVRALDEGVDVLEVGVGIIIASGKSRGRVGLLGLSRERGRGYTSYTPKTHTNTRYSLR